MIGYHDQSSYRSIRSSLLNSQAAVISCEYPASLASQKVMYTWIIYFALEVYREYAHNCGSAEEF